MAIARILSVAFNEQQAVTRNTILAQAGFALAPANTTTRAFELLGMLRFNLVVLGHSIPTPERRLLTLEVRRKWGIPVLLVEAGEMDPVLRVEAHSDNLDQPEALLAAVRDLLPAPAIPKKKHRDAVLL